MNTLHDLERSPVTLIIDAIDERMTDPWLLHHVVEVSSTYGLMILVASQNAAGREQNLRGVSSMKELSLETKGKLRTTSSWRVMDVVKGSSCIE